MLTAEFFGCSFKRFQVVGDQLEFLFKFCALAFGEFGSFFTTFQVSFNHDKFTCNFFVFAVSIFSNVLGFVKLDFLEFKSFFVLQGAVFNDFAASLALIGSLFCFFKLGQGDAESFLGAVKFLFNKGDTTVKSLDILFSVGGLLLCLFQSLVGFTKFFLSAVEFVFSDLQSLNVVLEFFLELLDFLFGGLAIAFCLFCTIDGFFLVMLKQGHLLLDGFHFSALFFSHKLKKNLQNSEGPHTTIRTR